MVVTRSQDCCLVLVGILPLQPVVLYWHPAKEKAAPCTDPADQSRVATPQANDLQQTTHVNVITLARAVLNLIGGIENDSD